jgi:hypothetical protein
MKEWADDATAMWSLFDPNIFELNTYSQITNKQSKSEDKWKSKTMSSLRQAIAHNEPDDFLERLINDSRSFQISENRLE